MSQCIALDFLYELIKQFSMQKMQNHPSVKQKSICTSGHKWIIKKNHNFENVMRKSKKNICIFRLEIIPDNKIDFRKST